MDYKKKILILGSSAVFLALLYILSLALDPQRINARSDRFTWLPAVLREEADRIEISRDGDKQELVFRNGFWFALVDSAEVPAKQGRVDDLFRILSTRGAFPRRGSSAANHAELGLDGSTRLLVRGGAGLPLLDLLVGKDDPSGRGVFLRRNGENEFRSGDRLIGSYVNGDRTSWYDLKLFEEKSLDQVQRVEVHFSGYTGSEDITYGDYIITRSGENWIMGNTPLNREKTETWIKGILEAQGEDALSADGEFDFNAAAVIRVELGDSSALELQVVQPGEDGRSAAMAKGKSFLFLLSRWTLSRLIRDREYFW